MSKKTLGRRTAAAADPPLVQAVRAQDTDALRALLSEGVDANATQPDGATALHWAAYQSDVTAAGLLITAGADVNTANQLGATALWLAAGDGSADMIRLLLEAGAAPNVALLEGETPIMSAARSGNVEGVRHLLAAGADVNAREHLREQTALMWAVAQGHPDVVRVLVDGGADVGARSKVRPRLMHADAVNASQYDPGVIHNRGGFTPLLFAARHGAVESTRLLLAAGADIDDTAPTGASTLVIAAHSGHADLVQFLVEQGADPNAIGAGYTALHAAVLRGDPGMVGALLAHGADPNARLLKGTPVRRASEDWAFDTAHVSATPFWLAARFREPELMRILADGGADPTMTTTELWSSVAERAGDVGPPHIVGGFETPLMAATRGRSDRLRFFLATNRLQPHVEERLALETVRAAIELGNDIDAADENGSTALHDAASRNLTTIVRFLVERGATMDVEDGRGRTPLALADAAEKRRAFREDTADELSTAAVLRELGAAEPSAPEPSAPDDR